MIALASAIVSKTSPFSNSSLLNDSRQKHRLLESLNRDTLGEGTRPVARKEQELKVPKEMNDLQDLEEEAWSKGSV